jgi:hypothetical protein
MSHTAIIISAIIGFSLFILSPYLLRRLYRDTFKDNLDIYTSVSKIVAAIAIPLIIFIVGSQIQVETASINQKLDWQKHDLSIVQEFQTIYFVNDKRGLSLRYVALIKDPNTKNQVRSFINWDILYRNIAIPKYRKDRSFTFDSTNLDWHWLGENLRSYFIEDMRNIEPYRFTRKKALIDFKDYAMPDQINAVFDWIEQNYGLARFLK